MPFPKSTKAAKGKATLGEVFRLEDKVEALKKELAAAKAEIQALKAEREALLLKTQGPEK